MSRHQDTHRNMFKCRNYHDIDFSNPNKPRRHTGNGRSKVNTFVGKDKDEDEWPG